MLEEKKNWFINNNLCFGCANVQKNCDCDYFAGAPPRLETYTINKGRMDERKHTDYDYMICNKHGAVLNDFEYTGCPLCEIYKLEQDEKFEQEQSKLEKYSRGVYWYSVRPPNGTDNEEFKDRIIKFLKCKNIKEYICTFEWKHEGTPTGIHAHMIINGNKYLRQHIARQKERYFNLDIKKQLSVIKDKELLIDKLNYMDGELFKGGPLKLEEKQKDKKYRNELGWEQKLQKGFCDFQ